MNKKLFWTTATLLTAALSIPGLSTHAESTKSEVKTQAVSLQPVQTQTTNVVKVGEYQSSAENQADQTVIARIQPHELAGEQAATLYVRNIPVLTFISGKSAKVGTNPAGTKVATTGNLPPGNSQGILNTKDNLQATNVPVWRASTVAAKLNQLSLEGVDASKITVNWKAGNKSGTQKPTDSYVIKVNGEQLVEINSSTRLPDKTNDLATDALQATNRLRRLIGNAPPLGEIADKPKPQPKLQLPQQIALKSVPRVRISYNGFASWYGPGFHGRRSANGERYNQNALTAAHRSLPFGTKVRVTNVRTGRSVVVRITDRGPFIRGRVIDLSAAAARIVGVMQSGVAPVKLDVLGR